jgi:hypothetical protein
MLLQLPGGIPTIPPLPAQDQLQPSNAKTGIRWRPLARFRPGLAHDDEEMSWQKPGAH